MNCEKKVFVLVDMDGVLSDYDAGFLEKFIKAFPEKPFIPLNQRNTFYVEEQYTKLFGKSIDAPSICEKKDFFLDLPPVVDAIDGFKQLADHDDVELYICTSPMKQFDNCVLEKYHWVVKHLGHEYTERIILTRDKTMVNAHFLIDDKPQICGAQSPSWIQVLFKTHHNRHVLPTNGQMKMSGWKDFETLHSKISEKFNEINM